MTDGAMLAQLIEQAEEEGADLATLRAIAEEAGTVGADRALARLGLDDPGAAKDMAELRELLGAWRDAKKSMLKAVMQWLGRTVAALVLVVLAMRLGFPGWLK
ncbi:DUF6127 family protein [Sphingomonas pokkalii]|uniref:Uncharacterized protein n=1 Tax=Sphingomonas pokkalii TaxID=2175090 RepID=A0A2U0SCA3_9SPHN|nr:DUF6127 family protein [Sphingomonas pokkalii]PVX28989.1 hypothetical protein DD559_06275 [Sphingomonas pokkalii]